MLDGALFTLNTAKSELGTYAYGAMNFIAPDTTQHEPQIRAYGGGVNVLPYAPDVGYVVDESIATGALFSRNVYLKGSHPFHSARAVLVPKR